MEQFPIALRVDGSGTLPTLRSGAQPSAVSIGRFQ